MAKRNQQKIKIKDKEITLLQVEERDYICLTDMADSDDIKNWLRSKNTIEFLGV